MVKIRKKSARQPTRLREKIKRKVREHNRKKRRDDKKNPHPLRKKKDIGVPNSLPFKETILKEAEDRKRRLEEERLLQKQKRKEERQKLLNEKRGLGGLVKDAEKKADNYEKKLGGQTAKQNVGHVEGSLKAYYKEFRKVVDAADVVLEVLDARDPLGSRCKEMEETVLNSSTTKRLVLILNKIDLVPRENVDAWLKYLKNEFPVVAFKASTQSQKNNLCHVKSFKKSASADKIDDLMKTSNCLGAGTLMKLLANYCRNKDIKTGIRVGVVGLPNTGKSSIINSLKRSKACHVGATPGVTKQMQEIQLDKHIRLLDSPGVVMSHGSSDTAVILRNCVKLESVSDCTGPVQAIIKRCNKRQLMLHYCIPDFKDVHEFLLLLAQKQGRFKKGGVPDSNRAARNILHDWNNGKLKYYTHPPEDKEKTTHVSAEFVTKMSEEFDIDGLFGEQQNILDGLDSKSVKHLEVTSVGAPDIVMNEDQLDLVGKATREEASEDEMEDMSGEEELEDEELEDESNEEAMEESEDEVGQMTVSLPASKPRSRTNSQTKTDSQTNKSKKDKLYAGLPQLNKDRKKDFKKMKKDRKRRDKVASKLSDALTSAFSFGGKPQDRNDGADGYSFDEHFK